MPTKAKFHGRRQVACKFSAINKHQQATTIGLLENINKFTRLASLEV
jgi:hypothetical protein